MTCLCFITSLQSVCRVFEAAKEAAKLSNFLEGDVAAGFICVLGQVQSVEILLYLHACECLYDSLQMLVFLFLRLLFVSGIGNSCFFS